MKISRTIGLAALLAGATTLSAMQAHAACIDTMTNTVDDPADCLFVDGGATDNCRIGISVDMDGAGTQPADPKKIECVDGAACDGDGSVNGTCTFRVGACVNLPVMGCAADTVTTGDVLKPSAKEANDAIKRASASGNRNRLQAALDAILPSGAEVCTDADIPVKVDLKKKGGTCGSPVGEDCSSDLDCDDYCMPEMGKNKINVSLEVADSADEAASKFKLTCLPATGAFANGAQALEVVNAADLIGGPLAMGRVGDFVIRNGNVRAVVRDAGREHSFSLLHGGQIIDADLVRESPSEDRDGWLGIAPLVNISSTQGTDTVVVDETGATGGPAIIESSGPDDLFDTIKGDVLVLSSAPLSVPASAVDGNLPVELTTTFTLTPYSNSIQMATEVQNTGGSALAYYMGDFVNPGGQLEPFGPGQGYGETLLRNGRTTASAGQSLDFLAFQGGLDSAGVTYGLIFPPTNLNNRSVANTGSFSQSGVFAWVSSIDLFVTLLQPPTAKPPGGFAVPAMGTNTLRRWFTVGETIADVTKARTELFGGDVAALQGTVTVGGVPAANAHVTLLNDNVNFEDECEMGENCVNVFSSTLTNEYGVYRFVVPPGNYRVAARKAGTPYDGNQPAPTETAVELKKKKTFIQDVALPQTGSVIVNVEDQSGADVAAKVSIVGFPVAPDPLNTEHLSSLQEFVGRYFGFNFEEKTDIFGIVDARFAGIDGTTGAFDLEPGNYHVVVSKGYEYDVYDQAITVTAGATTTVNATVNRVVDTTGFVSIDTHVHMINSPDSTISRERRILSMIAEGVDFFVNTDHDFVHDLSDEIAAMGAGLLVANAPSVETTTSHYGHFNSWPQDVDAGQLDGGAIDWSAHLGLGDGYPVDGRYDSLPSEIYAEAALDSGTQVIQVNHFNSGTLGHFNMLGIDTAQAPPVSSNDVFRCSGGTYDGYPCQVAICLGGVNDGLACPPNVCTGGTCNAPAGPSSCPGGGTCTAAGNLSGLLRMDPAASNLYDDGFTALEVWIEAGRGQTELLLNDNMADWFNLLNQGRFKAGTADSDTHSNFIVQAGGPRTFVASPTDDPALISAETLAQNVNGLRAIGSNGPFLRVELLNGDGGSAAHAIGEDMTVSSGSNNQLDLHIEAPTWAEFDTIDVYMNTTPSCKSAFTFFGVVNPSSCPFDDGTMTPSVVPTTTLTKGVDFTVSNDTGVSGFGTVQEADVTIPLTITEDTWVVVVVRGTDGVSSPLFPMQPQDLDAGANTTLSQLTDAGSSPPWNLNEEGALALAYSNPLFFDFENDGFCHGGTACP